MWQIEVIKKNDTDIIRTTFGYIDGKKQHTEETLTTGCNIGKINETTSVEQSYIQAEQMWRYKKNRDRYGETVEESESKLQDSPMLAQIFEDNEHNIDWEHAYAQPKFDGNRCLAKRNGDEITLWTRRGKEIKTTPHIIKELKDVMPRQSRFDGELYIHGIPLNKLRSFISKQQPMSEKLQLRIYDEILPEEFKTRWGALNNAFVNKQYDFIHLAPTKKVSDKETLMCFQANCLERGYEGAMLRQGMFNYESGKRSKSLLKVKTFRDDEFAIVDINEGRGRYEGCAIFTLITKDGNYFNATAPGSLEEKARALKDKELLIGKFVTIKYQQFTATNNSVPFLPICIGYKDE
jgi:DNA ligase-1